MSNHQHDDEESITTTSLIDSIYRNDYKTAKACIIRGDDVTANHNQAIRYCTDAETLRLLIIYGADPWAFGSQVKSVVDRNDTVRAAILADHDPNFILAIIRCCDVQNEMVIFLVKRYPEMTEAVFRRTQHTSAILEESGASIHISREAISTVIHCHLIKGGREALATIKATPIDMFPHVNAASFGGDHHEILAHILTIDRLCRDDRHASPHAFFMNKGYFNCLAILTKMHGYVPTPLSARVMRKMISLDKVCTYDGKMSRVDDETHVHLLKNYLPQNRVEKIAYPMRIPSRVRVLIDWHRGRYEVDNVDRMAGIFRTERNAALADVIIMTEE